MKMKIKEIVHHHYSRSNAYAHKGLQIDIFASLPKIKITSSYDPLSDALTVSFGKEVSVLWTGFHRRLEILSESGKICGLVLQHARRQKVEADALKKVLTRYLFSRRAALNELTGSTKSAFTTFDEDRRAVGYLRDVLLLSLKQMSCCGSCS
jgi:hypothetical protein